MYKINSSTSHSNFILTNHGHKDPYDILYNDKICDHLGTFQLIKEIKHENKDIVQKNKKKYIISTDYTLDTICTDQHVFLTKYIHEDTPKTKAFDILQSNSNMEWSPVHLLNKGHLVALSINTKQDKTTIPIIRDNKIIYYKIDNSRLWFLLGYFLHYGIIEDSKSYNHCIQLTIYDKKETILLDYLDKFIISIPTIFSNGINDFCTYRIELKEEIFQILSNLLDKKSIPEWIQDASRFYLYSFVHGFLYNHNGIKSTYNPNSFMYTWHFIYDSIRIYNIDIELLLSFQRILFKCDLTNTISKIISKKNTYKYEMIIYKKPKDTRLYPFFGNGIIWIPFVQKKCIYDKNFDTTIHNTNNIFIMNNLIMKYEEDVF